uniref:Uncharacterized protein n=1 Tax=Timema shepardi TaxID=629360 RepID=A0A7R9B1E2_TIMSH|nr:unnamed protein product [Timema shepardi]
MRLTSADGAPWNSSLLGPESPEEHVLSFLLDITDPLTKSSDEDSSDEDSDDGFGGSTVDIVILVIGSAVIVLFMVGMCYTCYKMRSRQRQRARDNARTRFRSTVAVIQVSRRPPVMEQCPDPSAPPVEHLRGVPPPYSPPPGKDRPYVSRRTTPTIHGGRRVAKMAASESTDEQSATKEMTSLPTDHTYLAVAPPRQL